MQVMFRLAQNSCVRVCLGTASRRKDPLLLNNPVDCVQGDTEGLS